METTIQKQISKFYEETGIQLKIMDGKPFYYDCLNIAYTKTTQLPDSLIVVGSLDLHNTDITELPNDLVVGGSLFLQNTKITHLPDNLIVGGCLHLQGTNITSLPNGLIVNSYLFLQNTQITELPNDIIVGDIIFSDNCEASNVNHNVPKLLSWCNGKYIKCDNIFSKVIEHKGNVWKVQDIRFKRDIYFLVTDGNGRYSYGDDIETAKENLIYKISDRDKSMYDNLTLDSEVSFEDAIELYRIITFAYESDAKILVECKMKDRKDKYTIAELIELTKGIFGAKAFANYFKNKNK